MRVWVLCSDLIIQASLGWASVIVISPSISSKLLIVASTALNVISRALGQIACSEALVRHVVLDVSNDFIVEQVDIACSTARIDRQATSILSSFVHSWVLRGDTIIEDSVVDYIYGNIVMSRLVNDDTIDTIVIGDIVAEIHGSLEVQIAGNIDSRAIYDSGLIVLAIVLHSGTEMSKATCEEEWEAIAVSVDNVIVDVEFSTSLRLSEDDGWGASGGPPDSSVDDIWKNLYIIASVASDTGGGSVMYDVITDGNILNFSHLDTFSIVVGPGHSDAVVKMARPSALVSVAAPGFICPSSTVVISLGISTGESLVLSTCFCTIDSQGWSFNL